MEEAFLGRLSLVFALGVNGLGGVLSIRTRTASRELSGAFDMTQTSLKEAESIIASETEKYSVALESPNAENYAKIIGVIISLFAIVESYPPLLLERLSKTQSGDARAILGVFRATSNRIDLLKQIERLRPDKSEERVVFHYYRGLLTEANSIRNKYAHAQYSVSIGDVAPERFYLRTFFGDFNRKEETLVQSIKDFQKDRDRLKRIICEFHAFVQRNEIPRGLHKELLKQAP